MRSTVLENIEAEINKRVLSSGRRPTCLKVPRELFDDAYDEVKRFAFVVGGDWFLGEQMFVYLGVDVVPDECGA